MTMNANTTELKVTDLYRYEQTATLGKIDTRSIVERNNDAVKREQLVAKCSEYRGKVSTVVLASASIKELEELLAYLQNTYVLEGYRMTFTEFSLALRHYGVTKVYLTEEGMQKLVDAFNSEYAFTTMPTSGQFTPCNSICIRGVEYFKDTK